MGIGARIREMREKLGLSQAELAHVARVRQPSVAQWETEKTEPTRPTLRRVADALGVSPHFLEFGDESRFGRAVQASASNTSALSALPVYGMIAANGEGAVELILNLSEAVDFVKRPPGLANAKDAYAIYLVDGAMEPWRRHGQIVYVNPARPAACGDHVIVQLKPEQNGDPAKGLVKLLVEMTARDVTLRQYNPLAEITLPRARILAMHRVMDWDELLQF
jgi:transcriptional regulator with XRE-family HTH domain